MPHKHLRLSRNEPVTQIHRRRGFPSPPPPDAKAFGRSLGAKLTEVKNNRINQDIGGSDPRRLLKIILREGETLPDFSRIPGIDFISQESRQVVLAFTSEQGLQTFESRLATLARSGTVTYKNILFAIQEFDRWSPEDRTGTALQIQGIPGQGEFKVDVELWPLELPYNREQVRNSFKDWATLAEIAILDIVDKPSLQMVRVRVNSQKLELVLNHRDVRMVDLPPRISLSPEILRTDIIDILEIDSPSEGSPSICVLDSGLTTGHALIQKAVGDAQGFLSPDSDPTDQTGHGTMVSGLALYGDVESCIKNRRFIPELRLFSGKVFANDGRDETVFIENAVEEAVRCFHSEYGCRVFNLSYGDSNKIYDGRHVRGLAYTLDYLSRELNVLFVVPTGNLPKGNLPEDPIAGYPDYLFEADSRLIDPAPALNVVTVGGLAGKDATLESLRYPNTIEGIPIAHIDEPSPFTRTGFSVGKAIKPDFVEEAGNWAVPAHASGVFREKGLGIVSLSNNPLSGLFREDLGTSFAAPLLAHKAARLAGQFPNFSVNLIRALLAVHAKWPLATCSRFADTDEEKKKILCSIGYGRVDVSALYESTDLEISLFNEEAIPNDNHHFYELPIPEEFWSTGRRDREIAVALAYFPQVRTTRLKYKHSKINFSLVTASSIEEVTSAFSRGRDQGIGERPYGRFLTTEDRNPGSLQMSRWSFRDSPRKKSKIFVVVTRQDEDWSLSKDDLESYALAITIRDTENTTVNLYERIEAMLQARVQERERLRARV